MSRHTDVESLAITAIVEEGVGALRKLYSYGVTRKDFVTYEEEFAWIEMRAGSGKSVTPRIFLTKFADFEWLPPSETMKELAESLKEERAFTDMRALIETVNENLEIGNAVELAESAKEQLTMITRSHSPQSDMPLTSDVEGQIERMRQGMIMAKQGLPPGMTTGFAHIDHHWDGLVPGRFIVVLGRTGEGKSFFTGKVGASLLLDGRRVGLFSPEMDEHEHRCRIHTLLSAMPQIQKACGLERSFRNRLLMQRRGFNLKLYQRFLEYVEALDGEILLFSAKHRRQKMSVSYIESRIEEMNLDAVIIDPIYKLAPVRDFKNDRWAEMSATADAVQDLAERYNIPVLATNQAHFQGGAKDDAPHKDGNFGSNGMIHEADHVIGVKNVSDESRMILRCTKSRFGKDFRFDMKFLPNTGYFEDLTPIEGNYTNGADNEDSDLKELIASATRKKEEAEA